MKKALILLAILSVPNLVFGKTFYLDVKGNSELGEKLISALTQKPCFTYLENKTGPCHAFVRFKSADQLQKNHFRYKVSITYPDKFNLQIYKRDGSVSRRILNAGDFRLKGDFFNNLRNYTINLTFK